MVRYDDKGISVEIWLEIMEENAMLNLCQTEGHFAKQNAYLVGAWPESYDNSALEFWILIVQMLDSVPLTAALTVMKLQITGLF